MVKTIVGSIATVAWTLLLAGGAFAQTRTFDYTGSGQWKQSPTTAKSASTQSVAVPELDKVESLIERHHSREASSQCVKWLLANKTGPQRDRALYLNAVALYQFGDRIKSYYYCDELLDEYPDSDFYAMALDLQYRIADAYLNGYKRRFWGMPAFTAYDEAIEMMYRIQNRSPGSPLAERALLRTADYYFDDREFDFAADTYAAYVRSYPRSPEVPRARLREALAHYASFRGPRFDATPMIDAREQFRALMVTDPQLAAEQNVQSLLQQIDRDLARKLYLTGDFYRRTHEPRGAAYTFQYLVKAFPNTPEAKEAQLALTKLPSWAIADVPKPALMPEFAPGSPPPEPPGVLPEGSK